MFLNISLLLLVAIMYFLLYFQILTLNFFLFLWTAGHAHWYGVPLLSYHLSINGFSHPCSICIIKFLRLPLWFTFINHLLLFRWSFAFLTVFPKKKFLTHSAFPSTAIPPHNLLSSLMFVSEWQASTHLFFYN